MKTSTRMNVALAGILVMGIGILLFLDKLGIIFPNGLLTWPMLLVVIGIFKMINNKFRHGAGIILILIGGIFLGEIIFPSFCVAEYIWPIALILLGIGVLFRSQKSDTYWLKMKCENTL
jgi:hypothetical protein